MADVDCSSSAEASTELGLHREASFKARADNQDPIERSNHLVSLLKTDVRKDWMFSCGQASQLLSARGLPSRAQSKRTTRCTQDMIDARVFQSNHAATKGVPCENVFS